jgi:predicted transcriptional regulator
VAVPREIRRLERTLIRMQTRSDSKYMHIAERCADIFETVTDLHDYAEKYAVWDTFKMDVLAGLTTASMESIKKMERVMLTIEDRVKRRLHETGVKAMKERARWRPVFGEVLRFLIDNPDYVVAYYRAIERPHTIYRDIAFRLGISFASVRDAFWSMRRAGLLPPA